MRILGQPASADPWAGRVSGHHLMARGTARRGATHSGLWSVSAPADIASRHDPVARHPKGMPGLSMSALDRKQSELLETLLGHYLARAAAPVANRAPLLLEYDNTQGHANHIHTVWRDMTRDWGGDSLAGHYRTQHTAGACQSGTVTHPKRAGQALA